MKSSIISKNIALYQLAVLLCAGLWMMPNGEAVAQCVAPPTGTMVAWYPFDAIVGGMTTANLATQNTGTLLGTPAPALVAGKVVNALNFNGATAYVESPSSIVTDFGPRTAAAACAPGLSQYGLYSACRGDFSIDAWVNIPVGAPALEVMTILDKRVRVGGGGGNNIRGYHVFVYVGRLGLQLADAGAAPGYTSYLSNPGTIPYDGTWQHIAVTVDRDLGAGIIFYRNAVAIGGGNPMGRPLSLVSNGPLRIGTRTADIPFTAFFQGSIDELEIFNRVLLPAEVGAIFNAGPAGKCKPPG